MNKAILIGRLTIKPELKYNNSEVAVTKFGLAVNRNFTNAQGERETDFINITVWRKQAENVCQYLDKGSLVCVEGRIQTGSYTDKEGKKVYTTDVIAESVQFLESKKEQPKEEPQEKNEYDPFADFGDRVTVDDNFLD